MDRLQAFGAAVRFLVAVALLALLRSSAQGAGESPAWQLKGRPMVDAEGIYLYQLLEAQAILPPPHVRLFDPPAFGRSVVLSKAQVARALREASPELAAVPFHGPEQIVVGRRARLLDENEVKSLLRDELQVTQVRERGELELRLGRPWKPIAVPEEGVSLQVVDLPSAGVSGAFIVRFNLQAGQETLGPYQAAVQAQIWKEVWVTRGPLTRGQTLAEAELMQERRDLLAIREPVVRMIDPAMEVHQPILAGGAILERSVRLRPVVRRGQMALGQLTQGQMIISLKVEVLEEGAPGDVIRVRNMQSRRELRGKVQDDQTILIHL